MNLNGSSIDLCAHLTSAQAAQLNSNFKVLEGTMNLVQAIYLNNQAKPFDNQLCARPCAMPSTGRASWIWWPTATGTAVGSSIYPAVYQVFPAGAGG